MHDKPITLTDDEKAKFDKLMSIDNELFFDPFGSKIAQKQGNWDYLIDIVARASGTKTKHPNGLLEHYKNHTDKLLKDDKDPTQI